MASESSADPYVDEFYFSALYDEDEIFPISDEKYSEELQMQEAIMSSLFRLSEAKTQTCFKSAESSQAFCDICAESKPRDQMFISNSCKHSYCNNCICRYIESQIREKSSSTIKCPDFTCRGIIELESCRSIVPSELLNRWEIAICEAMISDCPRVCCPFKDCSAVMVDDGDEAVTITECLNCQRLFCAECMVTWHAGISCREFQALGVDERGSEDVKLMELAKEKQWRRCPRCKIFVEKKDGCQHVKCRYFYLIIDYDEIIEPEGQR